MNSISRIKTLSSLLSATCLLLIVLLPLSAAYFWINFEQSSQLLGPRFDRVLQIDTIEPWQIVSAAVFSLMTTLVLVIGLWNLRQLFKNFKRGDFFTEQSTGALFTLSKVLFLSAILKCLSSAVLSVLLTWNNGAGEKSLIVSFGSNELWLLFIAATFLAITWSFKEGQKLAQENAEFV